MTEQPIGATAPGVASGSWLTDIDPGLLALDQQRAALAARRIGLDAEQRAIADAYHVQQASILERFHREDVGSAMSFNVFRDRVLSADQKAATEAGWKRSAEIHQEIARLDRDHANLDRIVRERRTAASRVYCETFAPAYREAVRNFTLKLIAAAWAYERSYLPVIAQLEAEGVRWPMLGEAFFDSFDGHLPFAESGLRQFLRDRVRDGHLSAEEVPAAWRPEE